MRPDAWAGPGGGARDRSTDDDRSHAMTAAADRDLLFGLLALQNGLIDQGALLAAFQAWTLDKSRRLPDHLQARGDLTGPKRAALEALAAVHIEAHGGDVEKSLAAVPADHSTRASLAALGEPEIEATLARVTRKNNGQATGLDDDPDRTATLSIGAATSDGQRFRLLRPHARGGLGEVFVALDAELHREVALKQILEMHADDPVSRHRFVAEAEITGGLEHPGVVPVYGLGTYGGGRPYYAMRFIRGDSLKEAIEHFHRDATLQNDPGRRALELRKLLRRFLDVCNAVDYAHSRGVIHRDLKPANIILGKHGETLVVDWGLAKAVGRADPSAGEQTIAPSSSGSSETLPGSALGTPAYMSPEQAGGDLDRLGPRTDVYSLGATLYCLLSGKPPFEGEDIGEILRKVQAGDVRAPREVVPALDRALDAVCAKAMATKPADRYATCRALAEDVERWMADEPVSAWREPISRRVRRWANRNRTAVASLAVALIAGVVGLSAVLAVQTRANVELRKANNAKDLALEETRKAQAETRNALTQSEESRKQAEAVGSFLVEAFRSPDLTQDGRQVKVAEVLDRAAEKLDKEFTGSPMTKGALMDALGRTYRGLGLYDGALRLHVKAAAVTEVALGRDHPGTLRSRNNLALAYWSAGRLPEAIALHQATLKLREARLGQDHPDTLASSHNLALAYSSAGRASEAIDLYEATLKLIRAAVGRDHPDTLMTLNNLANAYMFTGQPAKAGLLHEEILKLREAKLGPNHRDTLSSRVNLAWAYQETGRMSEALELYKTALAIMEIKFGPDHPDTLKTRNNLAVAYLAAGRLLEASALHETTLGLREAKLGLDHPETLQSRGNLASVRLATGRLCEAIALFETTLTIMDTKLGRDHADALWCRGELASAYVSLGRWADAESLYRDVLTRRRRTNKPDSLLLAGDLAVFGRFLLEQSRWSEAEPLLRDCLAIRAKTTSDDWSRYDAMSLMGGALLGQGRYGEAEPLVAPGYRAMKAREATIPVPERFRLREAAERVARLYEAWGKPEQAAAWKAELGMSDLPEEVLAPP
jgi:serine/threonine protein kinase/tetratricopeptide (TPR) repeat protein